ncbi:MAG: AzlD domain-containing protein [Pseudoruegeria sp.]
MTDIWATILGLAAASFAIRIGGFLLALHLPQEGAWARGMDALPGCLIIALVAMLMLNGGMNEWGGGTVTLLVAYKTRNLPVSMVSGILTVALMRLLW